MKASRRAENKLRPPDARPTHDELQGKVAVAVSRTEVQRLVEHGAQLVEVLPQGEYDDEHLPGAINIPLKELDESGAARRETAPTEPVLRACRLGSEAS